MSRPLLLIRPEPGFAATAKRAHSLGLKIIGAPLFAVQPIRWELPDPARYAGVLFTSANAVREAGGKMARLVHLPAFAVGDATAAAACEAGFASVVTGEKDVAWIVALIGTLGPQTILHLAGRDTVPFDARTVVVDRIVVYESVAVEPPAEWHDWLSHHPVALVHSPRAGENLARHIADKRGIALVAISEAAAQAAGPGWESVDVASDPRDEAMLALAYVRAQQTGS
jgi:uroporphyrinogen-III synthase